MTEEVVTKEEKKLEPKPEAKFEPWTKEERESSKDKYCCEILVSNGSLEDVSVTQAPNDALIVTYTINQNSIALISLEDEDVNFNKVYVLIC